MKFHRLFVRVAALLFLAAAMVGVQAAQAQATCPLTATPPSPVVSGTTVTLDAPFCPGPGANTLGYTTRTGLSDDVHSWSVVSGPPITGSTTGSKATVTLPTPGTYTYRVNRQLGYLRTTPPPTAVVLYPFGDTDITVVVTAAPPPDTTPDAFSFAAVGNLPRNSTCTSASATITGIDTPSPVSISGSSVNANEYSINGAAFTASTGTITNNQTVRVRQIASSNFSTATTITLNIGGVVGNFTCTTETIDTTPDPYAFAAQPNVAKSAQITSNSVPVLGFNSAATIFVSNGLYSINSGAFTSASGIINSGESVRVQHTSSASPATDVVTTLEIGGVKADFKSTTLAADTTPDPFAFGPLAAVALNTLQTSNAQIILGIDAASPIAVIGGEYAINGAAFVSTPGQINLRDSVQVRHTSATTFATDVVTTLDIGGVKANFKSTTLGADTTPDPFAFPAVTNVPVAALQQSSAQTIVGINAPSSVAISSGEYSINGAAFTSAAGVISSGQSIQVRHTSASAPATDVVTVLTIGGVTGSFKSTTAALVPDTTPDPFSFAPLIGVALATPQTSEIQTIRGINAPSPISVVNGEFSVRGAAFSASAGSVNLGDDVRVRHVSAATASTNKVTTLTIGGVSADFVSTTVAVSTNVPPEIRFVSPTANVARLAGNVFNVEIEATDRDGNVRDVTVKAVNTATGATDWSLSATITNTPGRYAFAWPSPRPGVYALTATATDNSGASTTTTPALVLTITAVVLPNRPPAVRWTSPTANISVTAGASLTGSVAADDIDGAVRTVVITALNAITGAAAAGTPITATKGAGNSNSYSFTWSPLPEGSFTLRATATDDVGDSSSTLGSVITVASATASLKVTTPVGDRALKPGTPFTVSIMANDGSGGGVSGQVIDWRLINVPVVIGSAKSAPKASPKAACDATDSRTTGDATTDARGAASFTFTPGCSPLDRKVELVLRSDPRVRDDATVLRGASAQFAAFEVSIDAKTVRMGLPGEPIVVTVRATDSNKQAVVAVPLTWTLQADSATGSITASSSATDASGEATASVKLQPAALRVSLNVCVTGRTGSCANFVLANAQTLVAEPARNVVSTVTAATLTATRLQMTQIQTRFQQLRNEQSGGFTNGVGVTVDGTRVPTSGGDAPGSSGAGSTERDINADGVKRSKWGVFSLGDIDMSRVNDGSGGSTKLSTQGLTVGVDYRVKPSVVVGIALGGLRGKATGGSDAQQIARGASGSAFMQWFSPGNFYANAIANYGRNSYDLRRFGVDAKRIDSSTKSTQQAFQVEGGFNYVADALSISPYLRAEHVRAALGGINESGSDDAITITPSKLRATTFALGLQADRKFSSANGVWIPGIRVEYLKEKQRQSNAFAQLINGTPLIVPVPVAPYDSSYGNIGLSLQWLTGIGAQPISVFFGFDTTFGKSGVSTKRFTAGVKVPL